MLPPRSTAQTWLTPKRSPVRITADRIFWAITVASNSSLGVRQKSQPPQFSSCQLLAKVAEECVFAYKLEAGKIRQSAPVSLGALARSASSSNWSMKNLCLSVSP